MSIYFVCTEDSFIPSHGAGPRWLEPVADYVLARDYWRTAGMDLLESTWLGAHEHGYQYGAIAENGAIVSCAAAWRFSDEAWELAAVSTREDRRRQGYGKRTVSFVTDAILEAGRLATCSTRDTNVAMAATARSVGFQDVPQEEVWWTYPRLPDF